LLWFDLPEVPRVGDYISIRRPDLPKPYGEDLIVRHIWWRLEHPETRGVVPEGTEMTGSVTEIFVECDPAIGPWASDRWRDSLESAKQRGIFIEELDIARLSIRQSDLPARQGKSRERFN
jgi:hypothetical protein